ncbi:MAG: diguanylate cyclase [Lachnospiraceae bacterium]|nr:diguanylate cyclase [Lachnospiraceae bacterium]
MDRKSTSIVNRLTKLVLGIIILQTILIGAALIAGGVIDQAEENAYQLFHDKVANRKDYLQREMKNNWTNFQPYLQNMGEYSYDSDGNDVLFFQKAIPDLIEMLRTTQATGVYVILDQKNGNANEFPALYLRDYDPIMNSYDEDDIYMLYGSSALAKSRKIPLDQTWRSTLKINEDNQDFIKKPSSNASVSSKSFLLGYWSRPFQLNEDDVTIITYSMPLFDKTGEYQGVIGIDITLNYLAKFLPASDLQPQDSLGYLIGYSEDEGSEVYPIIMGGSLQQRMIDSNEMLDLEAVNADKNLYQLNNHFGKEKLYLVKEKIGLYQYNTPYESEQWFLMGIMREDYLLGHAYRIVNVLWISLAMAIILGAIGGILSSRQLTKPIVKLVNQVRKSDLRGELKFVSTGLTELDELASAIENANKLMLESATRLSKIIEMFGLPIAAYEMNHKSLHVSVTSNFWKTVGLFENTENPEYDLFMELLTRMTAQPEENESDVFSIGQDDAKWIRYKVIESDDTSIGVIMDVTSEILEKMMIKSERDHDALTQILNRKGFQHEFEKWRLEYQQKTAALIMFDLDHLKAVNDTYGHKWGDQYILTAVYYLKQVAPESNAILGRRSGDEFVLLLHGFENQDEILSALNRFYQLLSDHPMDISDDHQINVSISGGVMWIHDRTLTYDELLHFADEALYAAKKEKKGFYMVSTWPE